MSGSTNAGEAFDLMASHRAAESTYAGIVRLVEAAQRSKAPMSRLADRFAMVFLGVTVAIAGWRVVLGPAIPFAPSPCSSSPHPARLFWRCRWPSCRGYRGPRDTAS